jgi:propanediol dehydratase small subunit
MSDYPLSEKAPERLRTLSGVSFANIPLEAVLDGKVGMEDLRVTSEVLEMQARAAEEAGRPQLAENLLRAAELTTVPEEVILTIYQAMRPGRGSREELLALAGDLERRYRATRCAALIREAADSSQAR